MSNEIIPEEKLSALAQLAQHPGWKVYCERFDDRIKEYMEELITEQDDDEANKLRKVVRVLRTMSPEKERDVLVRINVKLAKKG